MWRTRSFGLIAVALAAALGLAACKQREQHLGGADAASDALGPGDAAADGGANVDGAADLGEAAALAAEPCRVGGTRADLPTTLGCTQTFPGRLVVSGDYVYWTVQGPGPIVWRAPRVGGSGEELVRDTAGAFGLAVDDQFIYYAQVSAGRVRRVPLTGGPPVTLATGVAFPLFLVKDGQSLYWTDSEVDGKVMKLDLADGAQPVMLIDGQASPRALAVRDGYVYWTDTKDGTLLRTLDHLTGPADAAVRTANRLASGLANPTDLVLVGDFAYVPDGNGAIQRVPLAGGDLELVANAEGTPYGVASDGVSIYWSTRGIPGGILRAPLDDHGNIRATHIRDDQVDPHFVTVTSDNIYWTTWGPHATVARLAK
jgi:hypothetical protein